MVTLSVILGFRCRHLVASYFQGAAVALSPGSSPGDVILTNVTLSELRIVGYRASCGCIAIDEIPFSIPPLSSRTLTFDEHASRGGSLLLFVDRPSNIVSWQFPF